MTTIGVLALQGDFLEHASMLRRIGAETREVRSAEQLRALENGMRIDAQLVDTVPLGVDTPADLERARELLAPEAT